MTIINNTFNYSEIKIDTRLRKKLTKERDELNEKLKKYDVSILKYGTDNIKLNENIDENIEKQIKYFMIFFYLILNL